MAMDHPSHCSKHTVTYYSRAVRSIKQLVRVVERHQEVPNPNRAPPVANVRHLAQTSARAHMRAIDLQLPFPLRWGQIAVSSKRCIAIPFCHIDAGHVVPTSPVPSTNGRSSRVFRRKDIAPVVVWPSHQAHIPHRHVVHSWWIHSHESSTVLQLHCAAPAVEIGRGWVKRVITSSPRPQTCPVQPMARGVNRR